MLEASSICPPCWNKSEFAALPDKAEAIFARSVNFEKHVPVRICTFAFTRPPDPGHVTMKRYPAKLLLFGEHVLLRGAPALCVPVPAFGASWEQASPKADIRGLQMRLAEFARSEVLGRVPGMDAGRFQKDLLFGLFLRSDIPVGYGLGSSGALCAAVYDRYCRSKTADPAALKTVFAEMEAFFHGASSGIDPLVSFLNKPLLIRDKTQVEVVQEPEWQGEKPVVFLIDSGLPRQTGPLVRWFLEQCEHADFAAALDAVFLPAHEATVSAWLAGDAAQFWSAAHTLSRFQYEHFTPMVPENIRELWCRNLDNRDVVLKICGAGGGGFALGFARNRAAAGMLTEHFRIVFPFENT
jgi:mevalonate kinase